MTIDLIAEICHEAVRKLDPNDDLSTPWARLPKTQKIADAEALQKAAEAGNIYADNDAPLSARVYCAIAAVLVPTVPGFEHVLEGPEEQPTEDHAAKVFLYNHNPAFVCLEQDGKLRLSAQVEAGTKLTVDGHTQSHLDFPRERCTELLSL